MKSGKVFLSIMMSLYHFSSKVILNRVVYKLEKGLFYNYLKFNLTFSKPHNRV
jgi:hypothetical protein